MTSVRERVFVSIIGLLLLAILAALPVAFALTLYGDYQICRAYYPEINIAACMVSSKTNLPARSAK